MRVNSRGSASVAIAFLLLPAFVMVIVGVVANGLDSVSVCVLLGVAVVLVGLVLAVRRASAFVACSAGGVVVGLAPLWRTRLSLSDVVEVSHVEVDAFAEWGGWGVKGSAGNDRGRLYSAGGRHGVRVRTCDGRTYVVAFTDHVDAERAVAVITRAAGSRVA